MTETPRSPDGRYTFKGDPNDLLRTILRRRQQGPVTVPRSDPNVLLRQIIAGHDDALPAVTGHPGGGARGPSTSPHPAGTNSEEHSMNQRRLAALTTLIGAPPTPCAFDGTAPDPCPECAAAVLQNRSELVRLLDGDRSVRPTSAPHARPMTSEEARKAREQVLAAIGAAEARHAVKD